MSFLIWSRLAGTPLVWIALWRGPLVSVAVHAVPPSGSLLILFGGETDSSGAGTGGVGHIGDCGNWGTGLISGVDMESIESIADSISIAASGAVGDLGRELKDDLLSFIEFTIFSKFASDWSAS